MKISGADSIRKIWVFALGRKLEIANKLLIARQGDTAAALQDVWWAVLNSNEFIFNH